MTTTAITCLFCYEKAIGSTDDGETNLCPDCALVAEDSGFEVVPFEDVWDSANDQEEESS